MNIRISSLIGSLTLAATLISGCTTTSSAGGSSGPVNTAHLDAAYANAAADQVALVKALEASLQSGASKAAFDTLKKLSSIPGRTGDQEAAIKEIWGALEAKAK